MNTFKFLTVLFFTFSISACDKDNEEPTKADFSVLGITSITINNTPFSIKDNILLESGESNNIAVTGTQTTESTKSCIIEYTVIQTKDETPEVSASCCYSDVTVNVTSETTSDRTKCITVNISRKGYKEQVTYKFYFVLYQN